MAPLKSFMNRVKLLEHLSRKDIQKAGGKASLIGELKKNKLPVPAGFVVLTSAYEEFRKNGAIALELKREIMESLKRIGAQSWAVRSSGADEDSGTASFAGQFESFLFVKDKDVFDAIEKCWASAKSPRVKSYKKHQGIEDENGPIAVLIQEMVEPEVSGVCFTAHPILNDKNMIVIEAVYGLGKLLAEGAVSPDIYLVGKHKLNIVSKNTAAQSKMLLSQKKNGVKLTDVAESKISAQKISDSEIQKLSGLCRKIELYFGFPQDIEWAFNKEGFHILQSRPITAISQ